MKETTEDTTVIQAPEAESSLVLRKGEQLDRGLPTDSIRGSWNFSLDVIRQRISHYPTNAQESLIALFKWCTDERHPIRRRDVAAKLEVSQNLLYQVITGIYRNPGDKSPRPPSPELIEKINTFLAYEQQRYIKADDFIVTPTANLVSYACKIARESKTIVLLEGGSHIGKTWALRYEKQLHFRETVLAELDAAEGFAGMMRILATASGISEKTNSRDLKRSLHRIWNPELLVLIDEMHLLKGTYRRDTFFRCVEAIRRLHDFTRCPMVLCWTDIKDLEAAKSAELAQIWRRGVHKIVLPNMPSRGDIGCILHRHGFTGEAVKDVDGRLIPDCVFPARDLEVSLPSRKDAIVLKPYEVLRNLAKDDGLLAITERLRYARKLATRASQKLSWHYFLDAHVRLEKQRQKEPDWV